MSHWRSGTTQFLRKTCVLSRDAVCLRQTVDSNSHKPRRSDNEAERHGWQQLLKSPNQWGKVWWGTWWRMLLFSFITTQLSTPHSPSHLTQAHSRTLMPFVVGHLAELQRFVQQHKSCTITVCVPSFFCLSPTGFFFFFFGDVLCKHHSWLSRGENTTAVHRQFEYCQPLFSGCENKKAPYKILDKSKLISCTGI